MTRTSFRFEKEDIEKGFYETAFNRFGRKKGAIQDAMNEAVELWVRTYGLQKVKARA